MLHKQNYPLLDDIIETVKSLGVETEWSFIRSPVKSVRGVPAQYCSKWDVADDGLMLDNNEMESAFSTLKKKFWSKKGEVAPTDAISQVRMRRVIDYYKTSTWNVACCAGASDMVIDASGGFMLCEMTSAVTSLKKFEWDISLCLKNLDKSLNIRKLPLSWGCSCAHECNIGNTFRTDAQALTDIVKILKNK